MENDAIINKINILSYKFKFDYEGGNIMTKLFALIILFLLTIFPNSSYLECQSQQLAFPGEEAACEMITEYIKDNDVEAIYNLYCEEDKQVNENLKEQIQGVINSFDGKILKTKNVPVGHQSDYANNGVYQSKRTFVMDVFTANETYEVYIFWVTVDTESPEKVGLSAITVYDSESNLVAEAY